MKREEVLRMANEVWGPLAACMSEPQLLQFTRLVEEAKKEDCAKVCEDLLAWNEDDPGESAARAISAMSEDA